MRIGLTYDLRADYLAEGYSEEETAEFDQPVTIAAIESALNGLGHQTDRIGNGRQLVERLAAGDRWDLVFNIAEGLHGLAREAQVPAILDLYQIPYTFSDPLVLALALHKGMTKAVVRDAGVPTADFAVVERIEDLSTADAPAAAFRQAGGRGDRQGGHAGLEDRRPASRSGRNCRRTAGPVSPAGAGRDVSVRPRVHRRHCGTGPRAEVLGSMEVILLPGAEAEVYSYVNKERCDEFCHYAPGKPDEDAEVRQAEALALAAYRVLGCRDAGRVDHPQRRGQPAAFHRGQSPGRHQSGPFRPAHSLRHEGDFLCDADRADSSVGVEAGRGDGLRYWPARLIIEESRPGDGVVRSGRANACPEGAWTYQPGAGVRRPGS